MSFREWLRRLWKGQGPKWEASEPRYIPTNEDAPLRTSNID